MGGLQERGGGHDGRREGYSRGSFSGSHRGQTWNFNISRWFVLDRMVGYSLPKMGMGTLMPPETLQGFFFLQ